MIYLLSILLLFGFFQSLLELKKDDTNQSKAWLKRILSIVYLICFLGGIIVILLQDKESDEANTLIKNISSSVDKIDSNSIEQINKISKTIEQTESLVTKSESLNKGMVEVLKIKDSLLTQYKNINKELSNQLEIDKKKIEERSPNIDLMSYDIKWIGNDSTSYVVQACLRNFGKRNASIKGGNGYIVFFDYQKKAFGSVQFPGNNNEGILESNETQGMKFCYNSYGILDFKMVTANSEFAVICLKIKYKDELLNIEKEKKFYIGWNAKGNEFGGLRDWQFDFAKTWENENYKFK